MNEVRRGESRAQRTEKTERATETLTRLERLRSLDFEGGVEPASEGNILLWSQPTLLISIQTAMGAGSLHPNPPQPPTKHTVPSQSGSNLLRSPSKRLKRRFAPTWLKPSTQPNRRLYSRVKSNEEISVKIFFKKEISVKNPLSFTLAVPWLGRSLGNWAWV